MRKIFVFMFLALYAVAGLAQVDTLRWWQREPTYYYWDEHYGDCYGIPTTLILNLAPARAIARYCYVDTSLKVIGIAAPSTKEIPRRGSHITVRDSLDLNREPEYFQLYEATDSSFDLVAEARWDTNHPRYRMAMPDVWFPTTDYEPLEEFPLVYEAYFDKPVTVRDSFYVATTTWNNDLYFNEATMQYEGGLTHYHTCYYIMEINYDIGNMSDVFRIRVLNSYNLGEGVDASITASLQQLRQLYNEGWTYVSDGDFMPIFPIFDTTGLDIHGYRWIGQCDTVRRLRLLRFEGNDKAYISWAADTMARWWEISYGFEGTAPERGMRDSSLTSMVCLDNLEPGGHYVVYVRGRCKDDTRGPWVSFITFVMPDSTEGVPAPPPTVVDRHTYLMPNPTKGPVTVFSSFRISAIEVYSLAGTLLETIKVNANTGIVNTAGWPQGAYILRVRTTHGDTAKRLIKSAY